MQKQTRSEMQKQTRSERSKKGWETRRANAQARAARTAESTNSNSSRKKNDWLWCLLLMLAIVGFFIWKPWAFEIPTVSAKTPTMIVPTELPVVGATCPTTGEAQSLFGVSVQKIGTESCGWVWRGKPLHAQAVCPAGFICTFDVVDDITVVHLGINQKANIFAGTWRLINAYPVGDSVYDTCALYAKEKEFGQKEIPSFEVRFQPVPKIGPQTCP